MPTPLIRIPSISVSSFSVMSVDSASQDPELLRRLLRAKDRMDAASHEDWPVQRLARVSRVSEAHFARSFKQAFGVPPHRYLLTRRIERATALLRDTDRPITEIAFDTGWERSDVPSATSRARARARSGRGRGPPCTSSAAYPPASSVPRTGPTSRSQFWRSDAGRRPV
jgi:transcriptional regulator GlxA family with amidase domain